MILSEITTTIDNNLIEERGNSRIYSIKTNKNRGNKTVTSKLSRSRRNITKESNSRSSTGQIGRAVV